MNNSFFARAWQLIKRMIKRFFASLRNNWVLKIISLLFAFMLWSYVITSENPTRTMTVPNVKVTLLGQEELSDKDLMLNKEIYEKLYVDVKVSGQQNELKKVTKEDIVATLDVSGLAAANTYSVKVEAKVPDLDISVSSISPKELKVEVQEILTKEVPVTLDWGESEDPEGYKIEGTLSVDVVTVSGARADIEKISSAVIRESKEDFTESVKKKYNVLLLDEDGKAISNDVLIGGVPTVDVQINVYRLVGIDKEQALDAVTGVAQGYEVVDVSFENPDVAIAGKSDVIEAMSQVKIKPVSVNGANKSIVVEAELQPVDGVEFPKGNTVTMHVQIRENQLEKTFNNVNIQIENAPADKKVTLSVNRAASVTISGNKSLVDPLRVGNIYLYVDLAEISLGNHTLPLQVRGIDGVVATVDPEIIMVTIG